MIPENLYDAVQCAKCRLATERECVNEGDCLEAMDNLAKVFLDMRKDLARYRKIILDAGLWREAPCCICGYNGPGYYQPDKHACAAIDAAREVTK